MPQRYPSDSEGSPKTDQTPIYLPAYECSLSRSSNELKAKSKSWRAPRREKIMSVVFAEQSRPPSLSQPTTLRSGHLWVNQTLTEDISFESSTQPSLEWMREYEQKEKSIFKYFNVENDAKFITEMNAKHISIPEQTFYLQKNVEKFLGEFVGKVPFTMIPYTVKDHGIEYAGMHVMDSYRKAGEREKAEVDGFEMIENRFRNNLTEGRYPEAAIWFSPPKTADYSFVFVLIPDMAGKTTEYIVRYDEKMGKINKSGELLDLIVPYSSSTTNVSYSTADDFLTHPQFVPADTAKPLIDRLLLQIYQNNTDVVDRSRQFEDAISTILPVWINHYIMDLRALETMPKGSPDYETKLLQVKATLLEIYKSAQTINEELLARSVATYTENISNEVYTYRPATEFDLYGALSILQQNVPMVDGGGSCPVVDTKDADPLTKLSLQFISTYDLLRALENGKIPESFVTKTDSDRYKDYPCPDCGTIIRGEIKNKPDTWTAHCPNPDCNKQFHCSK